MLRKVVVTGVALLLSACASERIAVQSISFSAEISRLQQKEILDNIDETIDDPSRLARRTTFGKGGLTFSDAGSVQVAVPFHILATNAGTATGQAGTITDSYQLSLVPEVDGPALSGLRKIYQAAVYPEGYLDVSAPLAAYLRVKGPWLYWTNLDNSEAGSRPPPLGAKLIGRGQRHQIWTTDPEAYANFSLLTLGISPVADRVKDSSSPVLQNAPGTRPPSTRVRPERRASSRRPGSQPDRRAGAGLPFVPSPNVPAILNVPTDSPFGKVLEQLSRPKEPQGNNSDALPLPR